MTKHLCESHSSFLFSPSLRLWIGNDLVCLRGSFWIFWARIFYSAAFQRAMPNRKKCVLVEHIIYPPGLSEDGCSPSFLMCLRYQVDGVCVVFFWACVSALIKSVILTLEILLLLVILTSRGLTKVRVVFLSSTWQRHTELDLWNYLQKLYLGWPWLCTATYCKDVNSIGMESWFVYCLIHSESFGIWVMIFLF